MTDGVLYLNVGTKHVSHLVVSLRSLRNHYDGPVVVLSGDDVADNVLNESGLGDLTIQRFSYNHCGCYHIKTQMHSMSPFDRTIFIDSDTLIVGKIEGMYPTSPESVVWTQFGDKTTHTRSINKRINGNRWPDLLADKVALQNAVAYPALNTGVVGFSKDSKRMMDRWHEVTDQHTKLGGARSNFIIDEIAAQLLAFDFPHDIQDTKFNASPKLNPDCDDVRIWHGHGFKFLKGRTPDQQQLWLEHYFAARYANWCGLGDWHNDKRIVGKKWPGAYVENIETRYKDWCDVAR